MWAQQTPSSLTTFEITSWPALKLHAIINANACWPRGQHVQFENLHYASSYVYLKNKLTNKTLSFELAQKLNFLSFQPFSSCSEEKPKKEKKKQQLLLLVGRTQNKPIISALERKTQTHVTEREWEKDGKMRFSVCGKWVTWRPPSVSSWFDCRGPEATAPIAQCKWCICPVVVVVVVAQGLWNICTLSCVEIQTSSTAAHPIGGAVTPPAVLGRKCPGVGIKHLELLFLGAERRRSLLNITKSFCAWLYFLHRRVLPGCPRAIFRPIT